MKEDKNGLNLGDQIFHAVDDIIASGNFDTLNGVVSDTVYKALDEVQKQLAKATQEGTQKVREKVTDSRQLQKRRPPRVKMVRVGRVSGTLLRIFGEIGAGIFMLIFLFMLRDGFYYAAGWLVPALFCTVMAKAGREKRSRLARADRYLYVMQGRGYMNLSDLAQLTNTTEKQVRKDLKKMIRLGIFPEGHLDRKEKCLMLNDTAYREYLRLEKQRYLLAREQDEKQNLSLKPQTYEADQATTEQQETEGQKEHRAMVEEGNRCIRQLRELNDAIEGEVISQKLFTLEHVLKEIFQQVEEKPEQIPEMRKFMDYYLPTTLKLVQAYEEFDHVSMAGEDILSAKAEIEKTLDTINMAFTELLNRLFRDKAFDISTDAQVLKTMLAREGLTRETAFGSEERGKI